METEKKMTLRLPIEVYDAIKAEAEKQDRSIHNMILVALKEYFSEKS